MADPLSGWNIGPVKSAILSFVDKVALPGSAEFVPAADRIAVFDNDGTLWCEQPMPVQGFFLSDRVKHLALKDPSLKERQPFKAFIEGDHKTLHEFGKRGLQELMFATHAGMTEREFSTIAQGWFASAKHPQLGTLFSQLTYGPQIELVSYLRDNGFKIHIVSGGGVDFIRAFAADAYGVPPERVIGSSAKLKAEVRDGRIDLLKIAELGSFDDREAKVENIGLHIGRRPILAFGNSDGDLAMLRYTKEGRGPRLALLLHHDDPEREFAYDRAFKISPLAEALDHADEYGITCVSMRRDWNGVFADRRVRPSAAA